MNKASCPQVSSSDRRERAADDVFRGWRRRQNDRERSLIGSHKLDGARQAGQGDRTAEAPPEVPTNSAMSIAVFVDVFQPDPRHGRALTRRPSYSGLSDFPSEAHRRLGPKIGCPILFDHRSAPGPASCHRPPSRRTFPLTPRYTLPTRLERGHDVERGGVRRESASFDCGVLTVRPSLAVEPRCLAALTQPNPVWPPRPIPLARGPGLAAVVAPMIGCSVPVRWLNVRRLIEAS